MIIVVVALFSLVHVIVYCFHQEKALKMSGQDDQLLGHMTVLMQYDWPIYEVQFCDLVRVISERRKFTYNLFFTYVVSILPAQCLIHVDFISSPRVAVSCVDPGTVVVRRRRRR